MTSRDGTSGEYKVRGCAIPETTDETVADFAEAVAAQVGWQPEPGRFHLFRVDVEDVTFIRWDDATNDQYVSRWPAHIEFVRRGTSPTSLSRPEEIHELLG